MVQRSIKIPQHGGPDGQGLPIEAFDKLIDMIVDTTVSDADAKTAIELCLSASNQQQWNDTYRLELIKRIT